MGVWSKLFGENNAPPGSGETPSLSAPRPGAPSSLAAIAGKLTITFFAHDSAEGASGNFVSAVTRGFRKRGQSELVLTLKLGASEDPLPMMEEARRFFVTVYGWAKERQFVNAGEYTQFGQRAPFGRSQSGVLYADARPLPGVEIPPGALSATLVEADEVRAAMKYGVYRILARLGERSRHFPFPPWSELDRNSVVTEREDESLLAKVPRASAPKASFLIEAERVRIALAPSVRTTLARAVGSRAEDAPFALLVKPAAGANAVLVWHPGQTEPAAISPDGSDRSRTTGSCLFVVPGGQKDETRMIEDGYSLLFSSKSWTAVLNALITERPLSLRMADGITLSLEWQSEEPESSPARGIA